MNALPGDRFWGLVRPWAEPLFEGVLRLRVQGSGNVPPEGPLLLVSNHQSLWDIPAIGAAQPRAVRYMATPRPAGSRDRQLTSLPPGSPAPPSCVRIGVAHCCSEIGTPRLNVYVMWF